VKKTKTSSKYTKDPRAKTLKSRDFPSKTRKQRGMGKEYTKHSGARHGKYLTGHPDEIRKIKSACITPE